MCIILCYCKLTGLLTSSSEPSLLWSEWNTFAMCSSFLGCSSTFAAKNRAAVDTFCSRDWEWRQTQIHHVHVVHVHVHVQTYHVASYPDLPIYSTYTRKIRKAWSIWWCNRTQFEVRLCTSAHSPMQWVWSWVATWPTVWASDRRYATAPQTTSDYITR